MKATTTGTLAVIAVAMVAVLLVAFFRATPVELAYPVEQAKVTWARRLAARWTGLWHGVDASVENARLRREIASLEMVRGELAGLEEENARLRRDLRFTEREPNRWECAEVLSEGGGAAGARRSIRLNKGSLAGIREGAVVAVPEGLVGQVVAVTPHTSEVLLVTDPSLQVACTVEGSERIRGILSGGTDDVLLMRHLKAGAEIAPESRVLTSGLGGVFPAGIPVGTLISEGNGRDAAGRHAGGLEREGKVRPAVDFTLLEDVFIRR